MPTKTKKPVTKKVTPAKASTKKLTSRSAQKADKQRSLKKIMSKIGGKGSPLVAIIIVVAVMSLGYFGYVYSSANTNDFASQRQACRDKFTKDQDKRQNCLQKVDARQAEAQEAQKAARVENAETETQRVDCASLNRVQKSRTECGGCIADNVVSLKDRAKCVNINDEKVADVKARCANQNRDYNDRRNICGPCKNGFYEKDTACAKVNTTAAAKVKADCAAQNTTYDEVANACTTTCVKGFYTTTGSSNCVAITKKDRASTQAECKAAFKVYDAQTNTCGVCVAGRVNVAATCQPITAAQVRAAKEVCANSKLAFDPATNSCLGTCVSGFAKDSTLSCVALSSVSDAEATKLCEEAGLRYAANAKSCTDECSRGRVKDGAGVCRTPAAIKKACNLTFNRFDATTNTCVTDKCAKNYTMRAGACVDRLSLQTEMSERLCKALGRNWMAITSVNTSSSDAQSFSCTPTCTNQLYQYFQQNTDVTSYCAPDNGTLGSLGFKLTPEQCAESGRFYLTELKACSSVCRVGHYAVAGGCLKVGDEDPINPVDSTCEGPIVDAVCADDTPEPAASLGPDKEYVSNVEPKIDEDSCRLLGRVWVKDRTVRDVKLKGGCSTQRCRIQDQSVVQRDTSYYCTKSVDRITHKKCDDLNRRWMPAVDACAARPHLGDSQREKTVGAPQCKNDTWVYVYDATKVQEGDICLRPSAFERVQSVAQIAGKPLSFVAAVGSRVVCDRQPQREWHDGQCRVKIIPVPAPTASAPTTQSTASTGSVGGGTGSTSSNPTTSSSPGGGSTASSAGSNGCREGGCGPQSTGNAGSNGSGVTSAACSPQNAALGNCAANPTPVQATPAKCGYYDFIRLACRPFNP